MLVPVLSQMNLLLGQLLQRLWFLIQLQLLPSKSHNSSLQCPFIPNPSPFTHLAIISSILFLFIIITLVGPYTSRTEEYILGFYHPRIKLLKRKEARLRLIDRRNHVMGHYLTTGCLACFFKLFTSRLPAKCPLASRNCFSCHSFAFHLKSCSKNKCQIKICSKCFQDFNSRCPNCELLDEDGSIKVKDFENFIKISIDKNNSFEFYEKFSNKKKPHNFLKCLSSEYGTFREVFL